MALVMLILILGGAPSYAVVFASSGSPITVAGYGSTGSVYGSWDAVKSGSQGVRSSITAAAYKFSDADNHKIYVTMSTNCSGGGYNYCAGVAESNHANTPSSTWISFASKPSRTYTAILSGSVPVTGTMRACLDIPLRPDGCSSPSVVSKTLSF